MAQIIDFPGHGEAGINKALRYFRDAYRKAGLTDEQISAVMQELEPFVRDALVRREFEFNLSGNFTEDQVQAVTDAHNACMKDAIGYFSRTLWLSLCQIAGLIGRTHIEA